MGGAVYNANATQDCQFCAITNTNVYLEALSSRYSERWRNFGLMWVYISFNIFAAIFLYWLVRVPKGKNYLAIVSTPKRLLARRWGRSHDSNPPIRV